MFHPLRFVNDTIRMVTFVSNWDSHAEVLGFGRRSAGRGCWFRSPGKPAGSMLSWPLRGLLSGPQLSRSCQTERLGPSAAVTSSSLSASHPHAVPIFCSVSESGLG